jgi:hypothetical protein
MSGFTTPTNAADQTDNTTCPGAPKRTQGLVRVNDGYETPTEFALPPNNPSSIRAAHKAAKKARMNH